MDYYGMDATLQVLFEKAIPLSETQNEHVRQLCVAVLWAGSCQLPALARWLSHATQQDRRVQWLRRALATQFLTHE